ncbi:Uncharacterised protein [uncultured archaeon]|nr:Uncharacterised protein [uncultured archaeon]
MIGTSEIFLFLFAPVFVFVIAFWLWMLIDCLKRQDDMFKFGGNNAKLIWILVIIFTGLIGAVIYYFLIERTDSRQDLLVGIALFASVVVVIILILSLFVVTTKTTISIEPYPPGRYPQTIPTPDLTPVSPVNQTPPSNATKPTITSIQPDFGTIGTKVVITGAGFTARDNNVAFRLSPEDIFSVGFKVGYINNLVSSNSKTIEFAVPEVLGACAFPLPKNEGGPTIVCPAIGILFKPGTHTYPVFVVNQNGTSNSINFTVSR